MKAKVCASLALLTVALGANGQLTLNSGDTYTYEFTSLPATIIPGGAGGVGISWIPSFSGFGSGDTILMEAFEDNTAQTPWCSHFYSLLGPGGNSCGTGVNWI